MPVREEDVPLDTNPEEDVEKWLTEVDDEG